MGEMMEYVDGFVLAVKKNKIDEYKEMASKAGKIWKKYGALQYYECVGDDLNPKVPEGMEEMSSDIHFPDTVKAKSDEVVVFSFIIFKSRKHRDEVNANVMKDPFMNDPKMKDKPMPFDMKRMVYGGFSTIVKE